MRFGRIFQKLNLVAAVQVDAQTGKVHEGCTIVKKAALIAFDLHEHRNVVTILKAERRLDQ